MKHWNLTRIGSIATAFAFFLLQANGAHGQSFTLDIASPTLISATAYPSDILIPSTILPPTAAAAPLVGLSYTELGLLPGDNIDALTYFEDASPGPGSSVYFVAERSTAGPGVVAPPDVTGENLVFVPPGMQSQGGSDVFVTNDGSCFGYGTHTQILDGDGTLIGPVSGCGYGGGSPFGLGLSESNPAPPTPYNDQISAFDWGVVGRGRLFCMVFSLGPLSTTLTPGMNPLFPSGAEPGDILVTCPGAAPASSPLLFMLAPAASLGLISGGPGCAPPACDDIDALSGINFSIQGTSPSVTGPPFLSPAAVYGPGPSVVLTAGALGLLTNDEVYGLEATTITACPVFPAADAPDYDGVGACDNCPTKLNPGQEDSDTDGIGDVCDPCTDSDNDGFGNVDFPANLCPVDLCPFTPGPNTDTDGDGWADECDTCPALANPANTDTDGDGFGDACDNCPTTFNFSQANSDTDGFGDDCDNCDSFASADQTDSDGDLVGNVCDACPHVSGGVPAPLTSLAKASLGYGSTGPGSGDDKAKVTKAVFTTATPFDPDSGDNVHVTMRDTATGDTLYALSLSVDAFWTQSASGALAWKYGLAGTPAAKAGLKESPSGSMTYAFKFGVKAADVDGPLTPTTGDIATTLEIEPAGLCYALTLPTCSSKTTKDQCKP